MNKNPMNSIWLRAQSHMTSHYTRGFVTTYMNLEVSWEGLWTISFGLSQFHGHSSWLMCEVALNNTMNSQQFQIKQVGTIQGHTPP